MDDVPCSKRQNSPEQILEHGKSFVDQALNSKKLVNVPMFRFSYSTSDPAGTCQLHDVIGSLLGDISE